MTTDIETLTDLLLYVRSDNRVCPLADEWHEIWQLLPSRRTQTGGWEPPLPLILGGWWATTSAEKRDRLELHIRFAANHGLLDEVDQVIRSIPDDRWAYEDERGDFYW